MVAHPHRQEAMYRQVNRHGPIFSFPMRNPDKPRTWGLTSIPFNFPHLITGVVNDLNAMDKYDDAITAYDEAIRLDPNYALTWYNKGNGLKNLGKYDEAIQACNKSIELDPNNAYAWDSKGEALRRQGKYKEAIQALDKAIELDPNLADAWNNKSKALKALGRTTESNAAFAKAKELGYTG